jgi:hypothetical protein
MESVTVSGSMTSSRCFASGTVVTGQPRALASAAATA